MQKKKYPTDIKNLENVKYSYTSYFDFISEKETATDEILDYFQNHAKIIYSKATLKYEGNSWKPFSGILSATVKNMPTVNS